MTAIALKGKNALEILKHWLIKAYQSHSNNAELWTFYEKVKLISLYIWMGKMLKSQFLRIIEDWFIIFETDTFLTKNMEVYQLQV